MSFYKLSFSNQIVTRLFLAGLLVCGCITESEAAIGNYAEAINKAGRQRMLSQRITKLYALEGLTHESKSYVVLKLRQQQDEAIAKFEQQLKELQVFSRTNPLKGELTEVVAIWSEFRQLVANSFTENTAQQLWQLDEKLLAACERVMNRLLDEADTVNNRYVNLSGRQRMLSQRVAKFYMLRALRLETPSMRETLEQTRNEFRGGLESLKHADVNTVLMNSKLEEVETQWGWLVSAFNIDEKAGFPIVVNDASEKILILMEQVTGLYEGLAAPK